jgi:hypothetical protein
VTLVLTHLVEHLPVFHVKPAFSAMLERQKHPLVLPDHTPRHLLQMFPHVESVYLVIFAIMVLKRYAKLVRFLVEDLGLVPLAPSVLTVRNNLSLQSSAPTEPLPLPFLKHPQTAPAVFLETAVKMVHPKLVRKQRINL